MDVKHGFCWKCDTKLRRRGTVKCNSCCIAEYCSNRCSKEDMVRHGSIECVNWSPKKCGNCRKIGARNEVGI